MLIPDFASYLRRFSFKCQILGEILFEIIVKIGIKLIFRTLSVCLNGLSIQLRWGMFKFSGYKSLYGAWHE